jgi:hypothetical protein
MSLKKNKPLLRLPMVAFVLLIVIGSGALSVAAVLENYWFINAANQILTLVGNARTMAANQKNFAQSPGDDIWADLHHMGQVSDDSARMNPWKGMIDAHVVAPNVMRIESDLPAHDCRRMALYFMAKISSDLGLVSIEAEQYGNPHWTQIFPLQPGQPHAIETACGTIDNARLALVVRIR